MLINSKIEDYGTAIFYLEELLKNGFTNQKKIYSLEHTALLRITPEFNALIAKNQTPKDYGKLFDSISICLSKGLGAPVGSLLLGNKPFILKSRRIRKAFGGGMRQAGFLAAAGQFALENNVNRLVDDHKNADKIVEALKNSDSVENVEPVETNIILFDLKDNIKVDAYLENLKQKGILALNIGARRIRFVTHLDVSSAMVEKICNEGETAMASTVLNYVIDNGAKAAEPAVLDFFAKIKEHRIVCSDIKLYNLCMIKGISGNPKKVVIIDGLGEYTVIRSKVWFKFAYNVWHKKTLQRTLSEVRGASLVPQKKWHAAPELPR